MELKEGESYYVYKDSKLVVAKYKGFTILDQPCLSFSFPSSEHVNIPVETIQVNSLLVVEDLKD